MLYIAWHVEQEWKWMISIEREYSNSMKFIDDEINAVKKGVLSCSPAELSYPRQGSGRFFVFNLLGFGFASTCVQLWDAMRAIEAVADGRSRLKAKAKANGREDLIDFSKHCWDSEIELNCDLLYTLVLPPLIQNLTRWRDLAFFCVFVKKNVSFFSLVIEFFRSLAQSTRLAKQLSTVHPFSFFGILLLTQLGFFSCATLRTFSMLLTQLSTLVCAGLYAVNKYEMSNSSWAWCGMDVYEIINKLESMEILNIKTHFHDVVALYFIDETTAVNFAISGIVFRLS